MEFEDWDWFMEPQYFFYGESSSSSDTAEPSFSSSSEGSLSQNYSTSSFVVDFALTVLSSVAKAAIPAAAVLLYQNYYESACPCDYKGSCHCESVQFEFQTPRKLRIRTSRQQSRYNDVMHRFIKVRTLHFDITKGEDYLNTFQVEAINNINTASSSDTDVASPSSGVSQSSLEDQGARAFCRRCGVHILQAPSEDSKYIKVNIACVSNPAKSTTSENNQALPKSAMMMMMATETAVDTIKDVVTQTALGIAHWGQDLIYQSEEVYKSHPLVQSLRLLGKTIGHSLRPYALLLGSTFYYKGSGAAAGSKNDLTHSTAKLSPSWHGANDSSSSSLSDVDDNLSSVSSLSSGQKPRQSRLEFFHAASTPKQANIQATTYGSQPHDGTPPSLPQQ